MQALRVIGAAMAEAGIAGEGRLTLSRHERMVMVEPRGSRMALFTLRAAEEVQPAQFGRPATAIVADALDVVGLEASLAIERVTTESETKK